jgi:squalene monooxygenase
MLFYHFFSVAFYSIYILLTSGPPAIPGQKKSGPPGWIELPGLMLFSIKVVSDTPFWAFSPMTRSIIN